MLGYTPPGSRLTPRTRHPLRPDTSPGPDTPQDQTLPGTRHPPGGRHPAQCMLGDTGNKQAVCILLECNLVTSRNEVVAKVIFLHLFVILFTGGVYLVPRGVLSPRGCT